MPFVYVKILENQFDESKKQKLISDLTDLIVDKNYFIIDELKPAGWGFGDVTMADRNELSVRIG